MLYPPPSLPGTHHESATCQHVISWEFKDDMGIELGQS